MLWSVIFFFNIGKYYYELAEIHQKNKWLYVVIGVSSFFFTIVLLGVFMGIFAPEFAVDENSILLNLACIAVGLAGCYGLYKFLERKWDNQNFNKKRDSNLLDDHLGTRNK